LGWALTRSQVQWDAPPAGLPSLTGQAGKFEGYRWRIRSMPELGMVNDQGVAVAWVAQVYVQYDGGPCGGETVAFASADGARAWVQRAVRLANQFDGAQPCFDADVEWPTVEDLP